MASSNSLLDQLIRLSEELVGCHAKNPAVFLLFPPREEGRKEGAGVAGKQNSARLWIARLGPGVPCPLCRMLLFQTLNLMVLGHPLRDQLPYVWQKLLEPLEKAKFSHCSTTSSSATANGTQNIEIYSWKCWEFSWIYNVQTRSH